MDPLQKVPGGACRGMVFFPCHCEAVGRGNPGDVSRLLRFARNDRKGLLTMIEKVVCNDRDGLLAMTGEPV